MAQEIILRHANGVQAGATLTLLVAPGASGIFTAELRNDGAAAVQIVALVPGVPAQLGPIQPPALVLIRGQFTAPLNGVDHWIDGTVSAPSKKIRRVLLKGAAGHVVVVVINLND